MSIGALMWKWLVLHIAEENHLKKTEEPKLTFLLSGTKNCDAFFKTFFINYL